MALLVAVRPDSKVGIAMILVEFAVVIVMRQPRLAAAARRLWRRKRATRKIVPVPTRSGITSRDARRNDGPPAR